MSASFVEWVGDVWRDQLYLPEVEGGRRFHRFLESVDLDDTQNNVGSTMKRIQAFHIIKFGYPLRRAGYHSAVFSARIPRAGPREEEPSMYFAYCYWPRERSQSGAEYICLSPTLESRDGEYRHRFLWYPQFDEGYTALEKIMSPVEESILQAIADGSLEIDVTFYPEEESSDLSTFVEDQRLAIKALAASLALDARRAHDDTLQVHSNPAYRAVMKHLYCLNPDIYEKWDDSVKDRIRVFVAGKSNHKNRTQCGQKIVPLTVQDTLQVGDVNFAPWREDWVGRAATDLVINGIAPMFPIHGNWTVLSGTDRDFYENGAMHRKFDQSLRSEGVVESLRAARQSSAGSASYRMGQLDAHIFKALRYAQEFVELTDLTLCTTSEYVGNTFATLAKIIPKSSVLSPAYLAMYSDPARTARYLFDMCYGAHMLHTRVGAIHCDLHLNNVTLFEFRNIVRGAARGKGVEYTKLVEDARIAYVAGPGGEAETYVFPHDGWYACLIDFSRALLGPAARPRLASERGEDYATAYYRNQISRALRVLHHYIPAFVEKNQEALKGALLARPDQVFRAMTAVDFLAIGRNLGRHLRDLRAHGSGPGARQQIKVAPGGAAYAAALERRALQHLVVHLGDLIDPAATVNDRDPTAKIPHAGEAILPAVFGDFLYKNVARGGLGPGATLVDVYNGAAPLTYSGSDYERFPPWARFDQLEEHLGGLKIGAVTSDRGERPFLETLSLDTYLPVLQERVRAKLVDPPADATSSWIAD